MTQGNLSSVIPFKFIKQATYFQHILAQIIPYHSKGKELAYNKEILAKSKTKSLNGKLQILYLLVLYQKAWHSCSSNFAVCCMHLSVDLSTNPCILCDSYTSTSGQHFQGLLPSWDGHWFHWTTLPEAFNVCGLFCCSFVVFCLFIFFVGVEIS